MAAQGWSEWLSGLLSSLWPRLPPPPGSHEARLEEMRVSALFDKEMRKPAGQRDEELVHKLRVERYTLGLANAQALRHRYKYAALGWDRTTRTCCGGAQWATQRIATSYRTLEDFYEQVTQMMAEGLAAAEARRLADFAVQPTLRLELPEALQQAPPRLDMCSECAKFVQQMEELEEQCRGTADMWRAVFRRWAEQKARIAASSGARNGAAAAPAVAAPAPPAPPSAVAPEGEAQQGQRPPSSQQQQQQQQQFDCGGSGGGGAEGSPTTPKQQQQQQPQQQLHSSSEEEQL